MFSENDPSREGAQRPLETVDAVSALYRLGGIAYGTGSQALTQSKRLFQRSLPRASVDNTPECLSRKRSDKEMSEVPLVRFNNVVRRFGDKTVLDGINLKIWVRNRLVILGQSGSGKSTLLRLIPGILQPTSGAIFYKNCCIQGLSRNELNLLRARIGMVFQYSALISSMTVRENLALPLEELGQKSPEEIEAMVKEKLALVGMRDSEDKFSPELSGGMRKRISLARALMMDPELILFDEPTAGLDPVAKSGIDQLIISLTEKKGVTSVIVTHEMDSAFRIATRMAMLYQGKIIEDDVPENFRHSANPIVHQFVTGEPADPIPMPTLLEPAKS